MLEPFRYKVGGCLQPEAPNYVVRQADHDLSRALQSGEFCYVFNARQMGKSSLLVRIKQQLEQQGSKCAYLDMTLLGGEHLTAYPWYYGILLSLMQGFRLSGKIDYRGWATSYKYRSPLQSLTQFVEEILFVQYPEADIFVFIDEIDSVLSLMFDTDDLFAWIRYCYNQRAQDSRYQRLCFALVGVTTPSDLIANKDRTPFNIGKAIQLNGFTLEEATPLAQGLYSAVSDPLVILQTILNWTGGQPFLTQKICQLMTQVPQPVGASIRPEVWVEEVIQSHLIHHWESQDEPIHLRTIRDRVCRDQNRLGRILGIYRQLLQGETVPLDNSREQMDLILSGLVVKQGAYLVIRALLYRRVFDLEWVDQQLNQLRPYAIALNHWVRSGHSDPALLLSGQALIETQRWAQNKSLSDLDYQFLAASQEVERQRIQQQLLAQQEREQFFRQLAEAIPQIVWIVEPDGTLSYLNQRGSDYTGRSVEQMEGWTRLERADPDDRGPSLAAWKQALATGNPYEIQMRLRDVSGHYRWFLNRAIPIRDGADHVVKWFGTSTDLDDLKREEEAKRLYEVEARLAEQENRLRQEQRANRLQRFFLGSVGVFFAISSSLSLLVWVQNRQAKFQEIESQNLIRQVSGHITQHLDNYLQIAHDTNRSHVAALRTGAISLDDMDQLHRYLIWQLFNNTRISTLIFGTPQGDLRVIHRVHPDDLGLNTHLMPGDMLFEAGVSKMEDPSSNRIYNIDKHGNLIRHIGTIRNIDVRDRPWYRLAVESGTAGWSEPFQIGTTDLLTISAYIPVYDTSQHLQGVFSTFLSFRDLNMFLENLLQKYSAQAFIIERNGLIIANSIGESSYVSDKKRRGLVPSRLPDPKPGEIKFRRVSAIESRNPVMRSTAQRLQEKFDHFTGIETDQELDLKVDSRQYFVRVIPYHDDYGIDWLIVVVVPRSDSIDQAYTILMGFGLLLSIIGLGLIGIVSWSSNTRKHLRSSRYRITSGKTMDQV